MSDDRWAARVGDMHNCPVLFPLPHSGGPVMPKGEPTVLIGGPPAARVSDRVICFGAVDAIASGAFTTLIGGLPAARIQDPTVHGGKVFQGLPTVLIGDAPAGVTGVQRGNVFLIVDSRVKKIYMVGTQEYYGDGASQDFVDRALGVINKTWSGPTNFQGESYTVESMITGRVRDADALASPLANQIEVAKTTDPPSVTSRKDPSYQPYYGRGPGYQHSTDMDGGYLTQAHEFGHSMGLRDEYEESTWSKIGSGLGLTERKTKSTGPPGRIMDSIEKDAKPTADNYNSLITGNGLAD